MTEPPLPLTALSGAQRVQAFERFVRFVLLRPALEEGVSQAQVAWTHDLPASTVLHWITHHGEQGLANATRSDRGTSSVFYRSTKFQTVTKEEVEAAWENLVIGLV